MLAEAGIPAEHVLVGAAIMCRPASRRLESAVGEGVCLRECAVHVRELVRLAAPRLLVPLGKSALRSLRFAFPERPEIEQLRFPESVGRTIVSGDCRIHPLYHFTARARLRRQERQQVEDWKRLGDAWRELAAQDALKSG
jgi:uracil-DNA glycosylase